MIKNFKIDYLDECSNLYVSVFNGEPWNDSWTFETARVRLEEIYKTPNFKGLVCRKDDKIIGAIFGNCEQWYEGLHYNLKEFFVDESIQRTGMGSSMIKHLEKELKEIGVNFIHFFTSKGERTEGFYKKNNYKSDSTMTMMIKDI